MTRNIETMATPPYGTPIHPNKDDTPAAGSEVNLYLPDVDVPKSAEDVFVLGHYFARPRGFTYRYLAEHFHLSSQKHNEIIGGSALNGLFLIDFRTVTNRGVFLHDYHSIVGHLGASFHFLDNRPDLARKFNFGTWHDLIFKSFFLDMLKASHPTAGETLSQFWVRDANLFEKATNQLRIISTYPTTDEHSRAAALRVFGYTAPFFAQCHNTYRQGAMDHLELFQTHQNPLVATAATLSLRMMNGVVR